MYTAKRPLGRIPILIWVAMKKSGHETDKIGGIASEYALSQSLGWNS